jgi:GH18 family chitinase
MQSRPIPIPARHRSRKAEQTLRVLGAIARRFRVCRSLCRPIQSPTRVSTKDSAKPLVELWTASASQGSCLLGCILLLGCSEALQAAGPRHGLQTLPNRPLVFGYLNELRTTNSPAWTLSQLDYDAVDFVIHGFAEPKRDGTLGYELGRFAHYREPLLNFAHRRGKGVVMSVGGGAPERVREAFATIAGSWVRSKRFAESLLRSVETWGYDGIDIDYEFPSTAREKSEFTELMREIHAAFKGASTNYVVMFSVSPGFYIDQFDWARLASCADFAFYLGYDWKNPANGPLANPGATQWLSGGFERIEARTRGALHYIIARGFPPERLIYGLPFYSSANDSWPAVRERWATNRVWFSNAIDSAAGEVPFAGRWWTTPECVQRKMSSVLDTNATVLANHAVLRGVGFWEFGHQDVRKPDLTGAIKEWFALRTNVFNAPGKL